jgi:subtilisin family serine protease
MRKIFSLIIILMSAFIFTGSTQTFIQENNKFAKNEFFVKTKSILPVSEATGRISLQTSLTSLDNIIQKYKVTQIEKVFNLDNGREDVYDKLGMERIYLFSISNEIRFDSEKDLIETVNAFTENEFVEYSELNYKGEAAGVKSTDFDRLFSKNISYFEPNDEMYYKQWYLRNSGSVDPSSGGGSGKVGADIKMPAAWVIELGSEDVVVAILDSGIKDNHPDLKNRIWINTEEIPDNRIDDDNNGYIDDVKGWDFAYNDKSPDDGFGHGTNIATVIGADLNNSIGFAGIDGKCKLMNLKNLNDDNSGEYKWWAKSIKYAVDNGADIINMSEGGDDYSRVLNTAVEYAMENGILIVAAMMNKGDDRDYYPASFQGVFAVGATDTDDNRCRKFSWGGGSCYGPHISVVAPGNKIYGLDYESNTNYDVYWSGTSQSTAIVSGIASLLLAQNNSRTSEDIKKIIKYSAKDRTGDPREDKNGWDKYYGFGRVDCFAALTYEKKEISNDDIIKQLNKDIDGKLEKERNKNKEELKKNLEEDIKDDNENDKPSKAKTNSAPSKPK